VRRTSQLFTLPRISGVQTVRCVATRLVTLSGMIHPQIARLFSERQQYSEQDRTLLFGLERLPGNLSR